MQLLKDRVGGSGPAKGLAGPVVRGDEVIDALNELFDAAEGTAADGFVGDQCEEALDLVQPGAVGRDEVHVPARASGEPRLDLRMIVRAVVVGNAVNVEFGRHGVIDLAQEGQKLLMTMTWFAGGEHSTIEHIERRKQCGRAVALVVMGDAFDVTEAHRQHRLSPLQRFNQAPG